MIHPLALLLYILSSALTYVLWLTSKQWRKKRLMNLSSEEEDDSSLSSSVFRNVFNLSAFSRNVFSDSSSSSSEDEESLPQVPVYLRSPRRNIIPNFWFSKKAVRRNWLELPSEVMSMIFTKVGTVGILSRVQLVCSTWRKLAKDPRLFRSVEINCEEIPDELCVYKGSDMIEKLVKEAVDRSCGQLVDFSIKVFATDKLMKYIIDKQCPLKRLRFKYCGRLSVTAFKYMAKKHPLLEELEICRREIGFSKKVIVNFGRYCPLLKSFRFNLDHRRIASDNIALAIAQSMPELRHLNLSWANLTDNGLQAILDGCLHLNFLDLSDCSYLNFAGGLVQMCVERNIELRVSGKKEQFKLITEMERQLLSLSQLQYKNMNKLYESLLQLQYKKPKCEHLEAGVELDDATLSLYIKTLPRTLTQTQSIYDEIVSSAVQDRESFEVYARRLKCICKTARHDSMTF